MTILVITFSTSLAWALWLELILLPPCFTFEIALQCLLSKYISHLTFDLTHFEIRLIVYIKIYFTFYTLSYDFPIKVLLYKPYKDITRHDMTLTIMWHEDTWEIYEREALESTSTLYVGVWKSFRNQTITLENQTDGKFQITLGTGPPLIGPCATRFRYTYTYRS